MFTRRLEFERSLTQVYVQPWLKLDLVVSAQPAGPSVSLTTVILRCESPWSQEHEQPVCVPAMIKPPRPAGMPFGISVLPVFLFCHRRSVEVRQI